MPAGLSTLTTPVPCNTHVETVVTTQNAGESRDDFVERHWSAVDEKVEECDN